MCVITRDPPISHAMSNLSILCCSVGKILKLGGINIRRSEAATNINPWYYFLLLSKADQPF
jgi:hypothetical protein